MDSPRWRWCCAPGKGVYKVPDSVNIESTRPCRANRIWVGLLSFTTQATRTLYVTIGTGLKSYHFACISISAIRASCAACQWFSIAVCWEHGIERHEQDVLVELKIEQIMLSKHVCCSRCISSSKLWYQKCPIKSFGIVVRHDSWIQMSGKVWSISYWQIRKVLFVFSLGYW